MRKSRQRNPTPSDAGMRQLTIFLSVLVAAGLTMAGWWLASPRDDRPADVPPGDIEFAWIHAATSTTAWERFVTGVCRITRDWPELTCDVTRAYPQSTTSIPEITLGQVGTRGRIRIRWYKLSQATNVWHWSTRLARRKPPPLAIIGGGSSDRAIELARAVSEAPWTTKPLLFFTTATATGVTHPDEPLPTDLMSIYPERTFRICFTNEQIAAAVLDFVWSRPDLRPLGDPLPALATIGLPPFDAASLLVARSRAMAPSVAALEWEDDPYSIDLANQFYRIFHESGFGRVTILPRYRLPYSVGGQYSPNADEADAAERLMQGLTASPFERQLLVLPTSAAPARRVLGAICGAMPFVGRSLVAVTGDSISLNNIFRDGDISWSVRALPVPLVFFAHQNPVGWDWPPGEEDRTWPPDRRPTPAPPLDPDPDRQPADALSPPTSTDETLLHRDLISLLAHAGFNSGQLVADSDQLLGRIHSVKPPVFDETGNRASGRGEFVMVLRPHFIDAGGASQALTAATLEVWTRAGDPPSWQPVKRLILDHGRLRRVN